MANKWLDRLLSGGVRKALYTWVDPQIMPENLANLHLDPNKPICYVLQNRSLSNLLVVDSETERLGLPRALSPIENPYLQQDNSLFFLTGTENHSQYDYSERLVNIVQAIRNHEQLDVQLVPVSIFWGRTPEKEDSLFKVLFTDTWATPNALKQFMTVLLNGKQTIVRFSQPLSVRSLINDKTSEELALRKISRILRVHFRRQREMAIGPDLSHRRTLMHSIIQSPAVQRAIKTESTEKQLPPEALADKARGYVNEIAADYSDAFIRSFDLILTRLWTRLYDGIEIHNFDNVSKVATDHEIVYVPCHRSHIDYMLLSYVIYNKGMMPPHIAAGANLNMPLIGAYLRRNGAFYLRRSFKGNQLYSAVLTEYLHLITIKGFPIEYFIEGGRSRTGRLLPPKGGMLAMTAKSYLREQKRPIAFIPTYIGYERLLEGSSYIGELRGKAKEKESPWQVLQATRKIEKIFGKVHLNFGEPIFLHELLDQENPDWRQGNYDVEGKLPWLTRTVNRLANQIHVHINRAAVINPITLLSLALLSTPNHALDEDVLMQLLEVYKELATRVPYNSAVQVTNMGSGAIVAYGEQLKAIDRVKHPLGDLICVAPNQAIFLAYFRNNILHLYIIPSLVACLVLHNGQISREQIQRTISALYPYLQSELFLTWADEELPQLINQHLDVLINLGILETDSTDKVICPLPNSNAYVLLSVIGEAVKETIERYYMTISLLTSRGSGNIGQKQLEDLCSLLAQRLSVLYEFNSPDFFDKAVFRNFIETLKKVSFLRSDEAGLLHFDNRLNEMAAQAHLVLRVETQKAIQHITSISSDEISKAMAELEQKSKKKG